jgi:hypothetical protein
VGSNASGRSLDASGIFAGFASDELALLLTTQSRSIQLSSLDVPVTVSTEVFA